MSDIFTSIYAGMVNWFGYPWVVWVLLFVAFMTIIIVLLELDLFIGFLVTALPITVFSIYQVISLGNWGLAVVVLGLGLGLAIALNRLFVK